MTSINLYSKEQIDTKEIGDPTDAESSSGSLWARMKNAVSRILTLETADEQNVKLTGAQTVTGTKTFSSSPVVPITPADDDSAVNSFYVNDSTGTVENNIVHKDGNEVIGGLKKFRSRITAINTWLFSRIGTTPVMIGKLQTGDNTHTIYYEVTGGTFHIIGYIQAVVSSGTLTSVTNTNIATDGTKDFGVNLGCAYNSEDTSAYLTVSMSGANRLAGINILTYFVGNGLGRDLPPTDSTDTVPAGYSHIEVTI